MIVNLIPLQWLAPFGKALGTFAFSVVPIRKKLVLAQLRQVFPEWPQSKIEKTAKQAYQHFATMGLEFLRYVTGLPRYYQDFVSVEGFEHIENALAKGKGCLAVSGHYGNWELIGAYAAFIQKHPVHVVAKVQHNPLFDQYVNRKRNAIGISIIPAKNATRPIIQQLKNNQIIAFMLDQDARKDGEFIDFLGKPASTYTGIARLAVKFQIEPVFCAIHRDENGRHIIRFEPPIPIPDAPSQNEQAILLTKILNNHLESVIRQRPSQWFWVHKRWKTQPPKEKTL